MNVEIQLGSTLTNLMKVADALDRVGNRARNLGEFFQRPVDWNGLGRSQLMLDSFANNMQRASDSVMSFMQPGIEFEKRMAELKASTGVADDKLKLLGTSARNMALDFGLEATQGTEAYLEILSKLSPELAKSPKQLAEMGETTALLAKSMRNDMGGATRVLTTMMNAYNIDVTNAADASMKMRMMSDMLTVSFKDGAVEVPQLAASMESLGATGYQANVSLAETLATLQVLGQKGSKFGADAGVAFRNVLTILGQGQLMPRETLYLLNQAGVNIKLLTDKSVPLVERLKALKGIAGNDALLAKLFGKENLVAGQAILQNMDQIKKFTESTQKASGASKEFADTIMGTMGEKLARMKARFTDFAISAYDSLKPYTPMIMMSASFATILTGLLPVLSFVGTALRAGTGAFLQYGLGLQFTNGQLIFNQRSLLGATLGVARFATTMLVQGVSSLVMFAGRSVLLAATALPALIASIGGASLSVGIFNGVLSMNPIGIAIIGIAALAGGFLWLANRMGGVGQALSALWNFVVEYNPFSLLFKAIDAIFGSNIMQGLKDFFNWVGEKIGWLVDQIRGIGESIGLVSEDISAKQNGESVMQGTLLGLKQMGFKVDTSQIGLSGDVGSQFTDIMGKTPDENVFMPKRKSRGDKKDKTEKGLEDVSGGGSKHTNITISVENLIKTIEMHHQTIKESKEQITKEVLEAIFRALNVAQQYNG